MTKNTWLAEQSFHTCEHVLFHHFHNFATGGRFSLEEYNRLEGTKMCMTGTFATRGAQVLNTEALLSLDVINTAIIYTCATGNNSTTASHCDKG